MSLLVPALAYGAAQSLEARRADLQRLLAEEWEYTLRTQPELATQVGDDRYNDRLSDLSDKAIADNLQHTRQVLRRFQAIDVTGFPEQEVLNRELMVRQLIGDSEIRAVQRLGNARDAVRRCPPGVRIPAVQLSVSQC